MNSLDFVGHDTTCPDPVGIVPSSIFFFSELKTDN